MQVIPAKHIGFCFGVERAISLARKAAAQDGVYTYGALIHNSDVIAKLEEEGIHAANSLADIPPGATAVIRSHGLSPKERQALENRAGKVIDATCPFVARIHHIVGQQAEAGRTILLFGASSHPEVQGIAGYGEKSQVYILERVEDTQMLPSLEKACLVSQTTAKLTDFQMVEEILRKKIKDLKVFHTICTETRQRQEEVEGLSKKCTHILVVGGHDSSNTQKLAAVCKKNCKHVQSIANLEEVLLENIDTNDIIGVVGGASTPNWIIMEVITRMSELEKTMAESPELEKVEAEEAATVETSVRPPQRRPWKPPRRKHLWPKKRPSPALRKHSKRPWFVFGMDRSLRALCFRL